jgi:hypothetical protein
VSSIIKVDQIQSDTGTVNQTSNLSFTGTGRRITGDMSNATLSNRVAFQSSTTNGNTIVNALPNGTSQISRFIAHNNSDPTNCAVASLDARSTEVALFSAINGTGTYLPLLMYTGGSERMRITTAGVVELTSGQLKFPASQNASADANTLDDYEEGLWTPVINGGYTTSRNVSAGTYVKIGSLVYIHCQLDLTTSNSGSGAFFISGLPFTSFNTNSHGQSLALGPLFNWNINNSAYQIGARINDSTANINFWNNFDAASDDLLTTPFANGATIYGSISGCYRAAS